MFRITQEFIHQLALLPVLVMLVLLRTTAYSSAQWLIAAALALSWTADSLTAVFRGMPVTEYLVVTQITLVLMALVPDRVNLVALVVGLIVVALASIIQGAPERGIIVPALGGVMVTIYAWPGRHHGLIVYFGLGALTWSVWALASTGPTSLALPSWYGYQATRLLGLVMVTFAVVAHARKPRLELT